MSVLPMWSPTAVQEMGDKFNEAPVGTGAFAVEEWVKGSHFKLVKNPDYKGISPLQEHEGPAYLDSITVKYVGEDAVLGEVLRTGEVNIIQEMPAQFIQGYSDDAGYEVLPAFQPGTVSSTLTLHSTRVWPISIRTEPSG